MGETWEIKMAAYLVLQNKLTEEIFENKKLIDVDNAMCQYLGVSPDPFFWHRGWVDSIGMGLAFGKTFDEIRGYFDEPEMIKIIDWLDENFVNASSRR